MFPPPPLGCDSLFWAQSLLRRKKIEECVEYCTDLLKIKADTAIWVVKVQALTELNYEDDAGEVEDGGDLSTYLLNSSSSSSSSNSNSNSMQTPKTANSNTGNNKTFRPISQSGRPVSGYVRPTTASSFGGMSNFGSNSNFRPTTSTTSSSRPVTSSGRYIRLGTMSMMANNNNNNNNSNNNNNNNTFVMIDPKSIDVDKFVTTRPNLCRALFEYLIYVENSPRVAQEVAAGFVKSKEFGKNDWWWKAKLAKSYYRLELYHEAEKLLLASNAQQPMVSTILELGKIYMKLNQYQSAKKLFEEGLKSKEFENHPSLLIALARLYELLNDFNSSSECYKKVLVTYDSGNIEAIACLASNHFYNDQPDVALRLYRRLLQMGLNSVEIWNNMGLCCFYSQQYDMALTCFERSLSLASEEDVADVWYNISHVAISMGDLSMANHSLKIAISLNPNHADSFNNLGVIESRKNSLDIALSHFVTSMNHNPNLYEAKFNASVISYKLGRFQESYKDSNSNSNLMTDNNNNNNSNNSNVIINNEINYSSHPETLEFIKLLKKNFAPY